MQVRFAKRCLRALTLAASVAILPLGFTPTPIAAAEEPERPVQADPNFERYVSFKELMAACDATNAGVLTDHLLQLMEGERVLLRTHRSGVSAKKLLPAVVKLAADQRDAASLERLAKAASNAGMKDLEDVIGLAQKTARSPRAVVKPIQVTVDEADEATLTALRYLQSEIRKASSHGNKTRLKELVEAIDEWSDLNNAQKAQLKKEAADALTQVPEKADEAIELLNKLGEQSRATAGTLAVSTEYGPGTVTVPAPKEATATCNLRNAHKGTITFKMIGTGKSYTL